MRAKDYKADISTLRNWEVQNPVKFYSELGSGNNPVSLVPKHFIYGNYIYVRDILFLYPNTYSDLSIYFNEVFGDSEMNWRFSCPRHNTKVGPAYFIDAMFKPLYNHKYSISIPNLPSLPEDHPLRFKVHLRPIYQKEWNSLHKDISGIMQDRVLAKNSKFAKSLYF